MLIKGGTIIDGTGKARFKGDVRIDGELIKEIGKEMKERNDEYVIDAAGKFVTPGFIDVINRSDVHFSLLLRPGLNSLVKQGITTIIGGSCGASLAPLINKDAILAIRKWQDVRGMNINWVQTGEFFGELESKNSMTLNFATLTGHGTLRRGIAGDETRPLRSDEMKKMEYLLEQALEQGSLGMSVGLAYSHEKATSYAELAHLASFLKKHNAVYAAHLRDEGENLLVSVNEIVNIARETEVGCHIYHFKSIGEKWWGQFGSALEMIDIANSSGAKITFDTYPYTSTATVLYLLLPDWVSEGGKGKVLSRLKDKATREKIKKELAEDSDAIAKIVIATGGVENVSVGKTIGDIAVRSETTPIDVLLDIIVASNDRIIGFISTINAENLEKGLVNKHSFIGSDGAGYGMKDMNAGMLVHPRCFGAFPKFFAEFVRDKNLLSWEEGVRKATSAPAEKLGLAKRGRIEKGYFADIIVFDPQKLEAKSTFKDPFQYSEGIEHVLVNGGVALREGKFQKKKHGRVLRRL